MIKRENLKQLNGLNHFIILTDNYNLNMVVEYFSSLDQIVDYKVITPDELIKLLLDTLDDNYIHDLIELGYSKTYILGIKKDLIYLINTNNEIILNKERKELISDLSKNIIKKNNTLSNLMFKDYLIFDFIEYKDKTIELALNALEDDHEIINAKLFDNLNIKSFPFIECGSPLQEVKSVAYEIASKIEQGCSLNDFFILYTEETYKPLIKMIFKMYNLPFTFINKERLYSFDQIKNILNYLTNASFLEFRDFEDLMAYIIKTLNDDDYKLNKDAYKAIIDLGNKYICKDYDAINYGLFLDALYSLSYSLKEIDGLKICNDIHNYKQEKNLFILGCYNGKLPVIYKHKGLFTLKELESITFFHLKYQNLTSYQELISTLSGVSNLYVTYSKILNGYKKIPSRINEFTKISKYEPNLNKSFSQDLKQFTYMESLDAYNYYGHISKPLEIYAKTYETLNPYSYDNRFKGIDEEVKDYIKENKLISKLSYTSLNKYMECPFSFYLNKFFSYSFQTNSSLYIGNLFHYCLEKLEKDICTLEDAKDLIDELVDKYISINPLDNEYPNIFAFYISIYKEWIYRIFEYNYKFMQLSFYECDSVETNYSKEFKINKQTYTLEGKIDKVLKYKDYVVVIDYKTGMVKVGPEFIEHGLRLQLPIYLLLLKSVDPKIRIGGAFLQQVMPSKMFEFDAKTPTLHEQIQNQFSLDGLYSNDEGVLLDFNHKVLEGFKIKFNKNKLNSQHQFNEHEFENIISLTNDLIENALKLIDIGDFRISPYYVSSESGCDYCEYNTICNRKKKDLRLIELDKNLTFIRGNEDE